MQAFDNKKMDAVEVLQSQKELGLNSLQFGNVLGVSERVISKWRKFGASQLGSLAIRYVLFCTQEKKETDMQIRMQECRYFIERFSKEPKCKKALDIVNEKFTRLTLMDERKRK